MNIRKHVTSLPVSQKIHALFPEGIGVESYFHWVQKFRNGKSQSFELHAPISGMKESGYTYDSEIPAYLASEIGERLPDNVFFWHDEDGWNVEYPDEISFDIESVYADTEADARGLMLCWLKDQGLLMDTTKGS